MPRPLLLWPPVIPFNPQFYSLLPHHNLSVILSPVPLLSLGYWEAWTRIGWHAWGASLLYAPLLSPLCSRGGWARAPSRRRLSWRMSWMMKFVMLCVKSARARKNYGRRCLLYPSYISFSLSQHSLLLCIRIHLPHSKISNN